MNTRYPDIYDDPEFHAQMLGIPYHATWYDVTTTRFPLDAPRVQRHIVNTEARAVRLWHEGGGVTFQRLDIPKSPD